MPLSAVFLDAGPLGLVTVRSGKKEPDDCRVWVASLLRAGVDVVVPEIADYEVRRELIRAGKVPGIARLNAFIGRVTYLPLHTDAMREAAKLWAQTRNAGQMTAPPLALDGDAIFAGQVLIGYLSMTNLPGAIGLRGGAEAASLHSYHVRFDFQVADTASGVEAFEMYAFPGGGQVGGQGEGSQARGAEAEQPLREDAGVEGALSGEVALVAFGPGFDGVGHMLTEQAAARVGE
jgi:predicted nucleic acid-binding protein